MSSEPATSREAHAPPRDGRPTTRPPRSRRGRLALGLLALAIVAVSGAGAYLVASAGQTRYGARAALLYDEDTAQSVNDGPRVMATQRALLQSDSVLVPAANTVIDVDVLRKRLSVELAQDSVMRVTVEDPSRARALLLTRRVVEEYVKRVSELSAAAPADEQAFVRRRLRQVGGRLAAEERALGKLPQTSRAAPAAEERVRALLDQQTGLQDRLLDLRLAPAPEARVLSAPVALDAPVQPRLVPAAAAGLAVGLLIAAAVLLALERRRNRAAR
jgi:hypothetical protein